MFPTTTPLIVLVDEDTAGVATVLGAAVQEHGRGRLVGAQTDGTFGAAQIFLLPGGTGLRVKTSRVTTGKGANLERSGVRPDIAVELTADDLDRGVDTQLQRAVQTVGPQ